MSLRTSKITWTALIIACVALLDGCASVSNLYHGAVEKVSGLWPWGQKDDLGNLTLAPVDQSLAITPPEATGIPVLPPIEPGQILSYWETIDRGVLVKDSTTTGRWIKKLSGGAEMRFIRPTAVSVKGNALYIVDMGWDLLFRLDRTSNVIEPIAELSSIAHGDVVDIYIAEDNDIYVTDTDGSRVFRLKPTGKIAKVYESALNLSKPVGVLEDSVTKNVYIADAEFDHIAIFTHDGELTDALGGRGSEPGQFLNITTLTRGAEGFYVGARVGQHIQVLAPDGSYLYSLDQTDMVFPFAIAADTDFRLFVADYMDNEIKIFLRGRYVTSIGGTGVGPGQFKRITDLSFDGGLLFVADSLNARIQVMRVSAPEGGLPIIEPFDADSVSPDPTGPANAAPLAEPITEPVESDDLLNPAGIEPLPPP